MTTFSVPEVFNKAINLQVTLDGNGYLATITYNVFAKRNYITIKDQYGNRILTLPLIGSSPNTAYLYVNSDFAFTANDRTVTLAKNQGINILAGYFQTSAMYYYPKDQVLVVTP